MGSLSLQPLVPQDDPLHNKRQLWTILTRHLGPDSKRPVGLELRRRPIGEFTSVVA